MRNLLLLVLLSAPAHADTALEAHARGESHGPWLEVDPAVLDPASAGLGVTERHTERRDVDLSPRTQVSAFSDIWANQDGALPVLDTPARGWHAGIRFAHDFGWAQLVLTGSLNEIESQLGGRGRYVDVGLWFGRRFKLSRWMTAWIALSIGERIWLGEAPPGELPSARQIGLSIGTTFR